MHCRYHWSHVYRPYNWSNEGKAERRSKDIDRLQENRCKGEEVLHAIYRIVLYRPVVLYRYPLSGILHDMDRILYFLRVREKSWEKAELRKAEKTMSVIIENKEDIAKLAAQILFESKKEEKK